MIRAIETRFDGRLFRSRAEARWAAFFKALGLAYEYEPEGYRLPSGRGYLPDFRLHLVSRYGRQPILFEIKGALDLDNGKLEEVIRSSDCRTRGAVLPALDLVPPCPIAMTGEDDSKIPNLMWNRPASHYKIDVPGKFSTYKGAFTQCEYCGEIGFEPSGCSEWMSCCMDCTDDWDKSRAIFHTWDSDALLKAKRIALSERFGT